MYKMNYIFIVFWIVELGAITTTEQCDKPMRDNKGIRNLENNGGSVVSTRRKRSAEILCRGLCEPMNIPPCYCDELCHVFNDCCLEYTLKEPSPPSRDVQIEASCETYSGLSNALLKPFGVVVVKNCLKNYSSTSLTDRCSETKNSPDPLQMIPVTDKNGLTFANVYCALCNDVYDVSPWGLASLVLNQSVLSAHNLSVMLQILDKVWKLTPVPEHPLKPRMCIRSTNDENLTSFNDRCSEYQEPVLYLGDNFRNRHCIRKDVIENCVPRIGLPNSCKHRCIKGINISMMDYNFERNPRFNSVLIKFERHLRLEYDSRQCRVEELLHGSRVKCVRLGCIIGGDIPCRTYEIHYNHFKLILKWYLRVDATADSHLLKRCSNMILNILSFSKIVHVFGHSFVKRHEEECDVIYMAAGLSYVGLLPVADSKSLQSWLSNVHFTYTEITGNTQSVMQRIYPGKEDLSDTPHHTTCTRIQDMIVVDTKEDKESMVSALARYPLPIPIYKCSHINMTVAAEELKDRNGNSYRKYKVMEVHCTSKAPVLFAGIWHALVMICYCILLKYL